MEKQEASPRPWRVDGIDISDANGEPVTPLYFNEQDEANARLIVDAVNERAKFEAAHMEFPDLRPVIIAAGQRDAAIAERDRLRDIVKRLAEQLHDAVKLTPYDAIARDLLREARAAIGEEFNEGKTK